MSFEGNYRGHCCSRQPLSPKKWEKMKWVIVKMTGQRDLLRLTLSLWLLLHLLPPSSGFQSCPSVCTCKWKNGESRKEMGKVWIRRNENSFDYVVVKFLMYFYASCSLWDVFWKVWKVRPSNLKNSLISLHSNWIWLSAMPRVTPSLPQANAIYITP